MTKRLLLALAVVLLAVVLGSCLRGIAMLSREQLAHDEMVTYISATGHLADYDRAIHGGMNGSWQLASEWKKLYQPAGFWEFRSIGNDLARHDNHPPLYYWMLHVWLAVFGLSLNSGIWLNIAISIVTAALLFGLARQVLRSDLLAAMVTLVWTLSPPVVATSLQARHYDLLACFTVAFAWLLTVTTERRERLRWWHAALLLLVTAGGLLTHYHFFLALIGGGLFAAARLLPGAGRRLAALVLAALAGVGLFVAGQPLFYLSLLRQRSQHSPFTWSGFVDRLENVLSGVTEFFGTADATWWLLGFGVLVVAAAVGLILRGRSHPEVPRATCADLPLGESEADEVFGFGLLHRQHAPIVFFLCWLGAATAILYLAFRSPVFAMHDRYLAAVWPFLAFTPVMLARAFRRWRPLAVGLFCLGVLLPGAVHRVQTYEPRSPNPVPSFARAHHFVIAGTSRGNLPRVIWHVPPDKLVWADTPGALYAGKDEWYPHLVDKDVFVADVGDHQDPLQLEEILGWLDERFYLRRPGSVWGLFSMWRLYPAESEPPG